MKVCQHLWVSLLYTGAKHLQQELVIVLLQDGNL